MNISISMCLEVSGEQSVSDKSVNYAPHSGEDISGIPLIKLHYNILLEHSKKHQMRPKNPVFPL